ncbi:MAG: hypothetical protein V4690_02860 [Patescibacteria group bacterium]
MKKGEISKIAWIMLGCIAVLADATQFLLEWLIIGLAVNPIINIYMMMGLNMYWHMKGQKIVSPKKALGSSAAFLGEMIPVVAELPLWTGYIIYNFVLYQKDELIKKTLSGPEKEAPTTTS